MTPAAVLVRRSLLSLLAVGAAVGVLTGFLTARAAPATDVALTFTVLLPPPLPNAPATDRPSAGLDLVKATELFVGTLTSWLTSPEFVAETYRRADLPLPAPTVRRLGRSFSAAARGGQVVDVRFRAASAEEAQKLAAAIRAEVDERAAVLSARTGTSPFRVEIGEPLLIPYRPVPALRGLVAGLVAFVVALNLVLLWDFLSAPPTR